MPLLRGCYRQLRRCSTRVGRAKNVTLSMSTVITTAAGGELGDCKSLCRQPAAFVPPPPLAMEWMEYGVSQSKSGLLCSEKRSENCALHFPVLPSLFICRVRRVACEASTHGYTDSFF